MSQFKNYTTLGNISNQQSAAFNRISNTINGYREGTTSGNSSEPSRRAAGLHHLAPPANPSRFLDPAFTTMPLEITHGSLNQYLVTFEGKKISDIGKGINSFVLQTSADTYNELGKDLSDQAVQTIFHLGIQLFDTVELGSVQSQEYIAEYSRFYATTAQASSHARALTIAKEDLSDSFIKKKYSFGIA